MFQNLWQNVLFFAYGNAPEPPMGTGPGAPPVQPPGHYITNGAAGAANGGAGVGGPQLMTWVVIYAVVFVGFYFLAIRPQRKRSKQMKETQASLAVGDDVLTTSGMFGRIVEVGHNCFVVEFGTNRGIRIPIAKSEVVGRQTPQMTAPPPSADTDRARPGKPERLVDRDKEKADREKEKAKSKEDDNA